MQLTQTRVPGVATGRTARATGRGRVSIAVRVTAAAATDTRLVTTRSDEVRPCVATIAHRGGGPLPHAALCILHT
jgi:hypothetical protein